MTFGDVWNGVKPEEYRHEKQKIASQMIDQAEQAMGIDIRFHIEEIEIVCAPTFVRYMGTPNGTPYGYQVKTNDGIPMRCMNEGEIELTIKQVPGGLVSNWVHENWKVGTKVDTSGPLGTFTYEGLRDAKTVIGIAGGSGITPFLSLARAIADGDEDFQMIPSFRYWKRTESPHRHTVEAENADGVIPVWYRVKSMHRLLWMEEEWQIKNSDLFIRAYPSH